MKPKIEEANFYESIHQTIKKNRHVDYLQNILKKYEEYKKLFNDSFTEQNSNIAIYKFRAIYLLKKPVWRDIEILGKQTFCDLAEEIIWSMGWANDHLHGFELAKYRGKSIFAPGMEDDPHPTFKTDRIKISNINYEKNSKLKFTFDYGDCHEFDIDYKGIRDFETTDRKIRFPHAIDQRGIAPEQYPKID